jgi:hypothetical protein
MKSSHMTGMNWIKRGLLTGLLLLVASRASAVERTLRIEAPSLAAAGREVAFTISASTDAGQGEQVGFLQAESSLDGGKTWMAVCYLQKSGAKVTQSATLKSGLAGTTIRLRVRAAFRDGLAGDVDVSGAAIRWDGSWKEWKSPPAKQASITVAAR